MTLPPRSVSRVNSAAHHRPPASQEVGTIPTRRFAQLEPMLRRDEVGEVEFGAPLRRFDRAEFSSRDLFHGVVFLEGGKRGLSSGCCAPYWSMVAAPSQLLHAHVDAGLTIPTKVGRTHLWKAHMWVWELGSWRISVFPGFCHDRLLQ